MTGSLARAVVPKNLDSLKIPIQGRLFSMRKAQTDNGNTIVQLKFAATHRNGGPMVRRFLYHRFPAALILHSPFSILNYSKKGEPYGSPFILRFFGNQEKIHSCSCSSPQYFCSVSRTACGPRFISPNMRTTVSPTPISNRLTPK